MSTTNIHEMINDHSILDHHNDLSGEGWSRDHKDLWWKLLYSMTAVTAAAYLLARRRDNKLLHCIKPFPVVILGYVVLLWCSVHSHSHYLTSIFQLLIPHKPTDYAIYISVGLFLSALGDFFLIFKRFLVIGVLFFLAAHLSFILAFTADHSNLSNFFTPATVLCLVSFNLFFVYLFIAKVIPIFITNTPKSIIVALIFYTCVIVTMCTTATIKSLSTIFLSDKGLFNWPQFSATLVFYASCGAIGAVLFFISDIMILVRATNDIKGGKSQISTFRKFMGNGDIGMITYWLGQFCIALSVTSVLSN